ncbi:methyltransferase [Hirsutella rhossiliensis]|uniref:Methyltransferase domain-containing protein n=1 Tax=Hirsutella rhossiliensis TaxID=111463 RepID=A0A9P8MSV2_9HYPO|nr:methyltransferase domain-containing protein [Hirsutella rhossiliensis]KAH0961528.1 methyltransferase domain-containing protein [Hirsutella rhossiliensis]
MNNGLEAVPHRRHPDPSSPSSSADDIDVATVEDAAIIQSIEQGHYADVDQDTYSLTDSIRQHVVDGHLRYHAYHAGMYNFPNDETEQYRDDLKHSLTIHLCDGNYFYAPCHERLERGAHVLDLGTGTGKWCMEMADFYPKSRFHGMDLSPIQPDWVPENVEFFVDDIEHENGWTYAENSFDYIHVRHTIHSIKDRPQMWKRIYHHLKPGGYVEVQEFHYVSACDDGSCDGPYAWRDFLKYLEAGLAALGSQLNSVQYAEDELLAAGFTDLRYQDLKCPVGPWPKKLRLQECGHILRDVIMWGLVGLSKRPFRDGLGWTDLQIEMFLVNVRKDLSRQVGSLPRFHSYFPFRSISGRKPP